MARCIASHHAGETDFRSHAHQCACVWACVVMERANVNTAAGCEVPRKKMCALHDNFGLPTPPVLAQALRREVQRLRGPVERNLLAAIGGREHIPPRCRAARHPAARRPPSEPLRRGSVSLAPPTLARTTSASGGGGKKVRTQCCNPIRALNRMIARDSEGRRAGDKEFVGDTDGDRGSNP